MWGVSNPSCIICHWHFLTNAMLWVLKIPPTPPASGSQNFLLMSSPRSLMKLELELYER